MTTILGWDMSHYDAPSVGSAYAQGIRFITHKAGGDGNDPEITQWWSLFPYKNKRDQVLPGAYWVLLPGDPVNRANQFIARLDQTCPGWRDGPFILQVDCEIWNGKLSTKPSRGEIKQFCDRLVQLMPKLRPIVYASQGQYRNELDGLGYPLWNANYPSSRAALSFDGYHNVGGDNGVGWRAYSGQVPAIWQFTSSATIGGQTTSDANAYRGSLEDLTKLLCPGWAGEDEAMAFIENQDDFNKAIGVALAGFFQETSQPDGSITSVVGRNAFDQGIPQDDAPVDPKSKPRKPAWWVLSNTRGQVLGLRSAVAQVAINQAAAEAADAARDAAILTAIRAISTTGASLTDAQMQQIIQSIQSAATSVSNTAAQAAKDKVDAVFAQLAVVGEEMSKLNQPQEVPQS